MLLKEDLEHSPESVLELIKAANTDYFVEFEGGERCKVRFPHLTPEAKVQLLDKIDAIGIDSMYRHSVGTSRYTLNHTLGFFHYKSFKIKVMAQDVRHASLVLKDGSCYVLNFQLEPLIKSLPTNEAEEANFIAAGGEMMQGSTCTIL